jgi:diadenosine tetraphosphatase ApaH/serine/threonine PP2A family protein phosphatase
VGISRVDVNVCLIDHNNGLTLVARAHQLVMEGYSFVYLSSY